MQTKRRDDLSAHPLDKALEAIDAGQKEEAKTYVRQLWEEGRPLHDLMCDSGALNLNFIAEKLGEEAIEEATRYMGEILWKPVAMSMQHGGLDTLVSMFAAMLRAHGVDFYVEEDDEKFSFVVRYCTSGGRMMKEGKVDTSDRHPLNFGATKKAYPWSFNQAGIPYYCCHCCVCMEMQSREWGLDIFEHHFGRQFDEQGNPVDEPCRTIIYKTKRNKS